MPVDVNDVGTIAARLDEHGRVIGDHDRLLGDLDRRTGRLSLVVYGDNEQEFHGLLERVTLQEAALRDFVDWRRDMTVRWETTLLLIRIGLIVMGLTGAGVWLPILRQVFDAIP